jgi:hypothetical protein
MSEKKFQSTFVKVDIRNDAGDILIYEVPERLEDEIAVGDVVYVPVNRCRCGGARYTDAAVVEVFEAVYPPRDGVLFIVDKIDMESFRDDIARKRRKAELKAAMAKRAEEIKEIKAYKKAAKKGDKAMKRLLAEYGE